MNRSIALAAALACVVAPLGQAADNSGAAVVQPRPAPVSMAPPDEDAIPAGRVGDVIRTGLAIVTQTRRHASAYTGGDLNCTSCHLDRGRTPDAAPWVGLWGMFPEYRSRSGRVILLEDRINDCFRRSMNGKPLPSDSAEMVAVSAYIRWLSNGVPTGTEVRGRGFRRLDAPADVDEARGRAGFERQCAACHGSDGQGMTASDGAYLYPPLWGPRSFNIGAGMARLDTAAAFIKANMPWLRGGSLSDQEAYDIAAYVTRQPRPDYPDKDKDWPRGGKPRDARY